MNHLVILSSYLVAKVKSVLRSEASKRAIDEKRFNKMHHLEGFPLLFDVIVGLEILHSVQLSMHMWKQQKKDETGEKKHLVTYLLNKCNTGVYL